MPRKSSQQPMSQDRYAEEIRHLVRGQVTALHNVKIMQMKCRLLTTILDEYSRALFSFYSAEESLLKKLEAAAFKVEAQKNAHLRRQQQAQWNQIFSAATQRLDCAHEA